MVFYYLFCCCVFFTYMDYFDRVSLATVVMKYAHVRMEEVVTTLPESAFARQGSLVINVKMAAVLDILVSNVINSVQVHVCQAFVTEHSGSVPAKQVSSGQYVTNNVRRTHGVLIATKSK